MLIGLKLLSAVNQIDFMPLVISNDLDFKQSFEVTTKIACSRLTAKTVIEMQLQLPLTFSFSLDSVSIVNIAYFDTFNPLFKAKQTKPLSFEML